MSGLLLGVRLLAATTTVLLAAVALPRRLFARRAWVLGVTAVSGIVALEPYGSPLVVLVTLSWLTLVAQVEPPAPRPGRQWRRRLADRLGDGMTGLDHLPPYF